MERMEGGREMRRRMRRMEQALLRVRRPKAAALSKPRSTDGAATAASRSRHCGFKKPLGADGAATAAARSLVASGFTRGTAAATAASRRTAVLTRRSTAVLPLCVREE